MPRRRNGGGALPTDAVMDEVRSAARSAGRAAMDALIQLACEGEGVPAPVRLAAIKELLDRGFGRPGAAPAESGGGITTHLVVDDGYAN